MTLHEKLIALIKSRRGRGVKFGQGIWTADKFVSSLAECIGPGMCQTRFGMAQGQLPSLMKEAGNTLTICGDLLDIDRDDRFRVKLATSTTAIKKMLGDMELPPKSLMAFAHTLTTPREDRDGDVLETAGAQVDPKMPLLWQHVHTLPIGRALKTLEQSPERLRMASVLLDMNELTHDAAILIEADALRFSHGFRALEFTERNKEAAGAPGFRVKAFEVMEESLVSVPSNIDAELEVWSRGKLKSTEFKTHAKALDRMRVKSHAGVAMPTKKSVGKKDEDGDNDMGTCPHCGGKGVKREGGNDTCENGHCYPTSAAKSKHDCGCGGKCGGCGDRKSGDKAGMDRESFATQAEAEARAAEIGCTGSHFDDGKWHPCSDQWSYAIWTGPNTEPVTKPTGRTDTAMVIDKQWVDSSALNGSYYYRMNKLNDSALRNLMSAGIDVGRDDYASVWAMFDKYAIVMLQRSVMQEPSSGDGCRYYRCEWAETKGEPSWTGAVVEVEVANDVSISEIGKHVLTEAVKSLGRFVDTRGGRTLSQANLDKIDSVIQDLAELSSMEISRGASALVNRCQRVLDDLLSTAKPITDDDPQPKTINERDAVRKLMECTDVKLLTQAIKALSTVIAQHEQSERVSQFKQLLRR